MCHLYDLHDSFKDDTPGWENLIVVTVIVFVTIYNHVVTVVTAREVESRCQGLEGIVG